MDYTLSNSYDIDAGTGNRMHEDSKAVTTAVSDLDMNSLIWSCMEVVKAAGLAGIQFDKANPASYRLFLKALRSGLMVSGIDTGAANASVVDLTPPIDALSDGMRLWVKAKAGNNGPATLNVNSLGAKPIMGAGLNALQGGEIVANGWYLVVFSLAANAFILIECTGAALQVGPATKSQHALQLGQAIGRLLRKLVYMRVGGVQMVSINGGAFTATGAGTYVPGSTMSFCIVKVQGASGAGGGPTLPSAGNVSLGSPGAGGAYGESLYTLAQIGASQAITVGLAGAKVVGGAGGNGGASSFGSFLTSPGGVGGGVLNNQVPPTAAGNGNVAAATGANLFQINGLGGYPALATSASAGGNVGGVGGSSAFGPGVTGGTNAAGTDSQNFGVGGSGAVINNGFGGNTAGGGGFGGIVTVEEFA